MAVVKPRLAPVSVVLDRQKSRKSKQVNIAEKTWKRKSKSLSLPESNKLSIWWKRNKAIKKIRKEYKEDKNRLKEWEKWRQNEEKKIQNARIENARLEREEEYLQQLLHLKHEKALSDRKKLDTKYPFPTDNREAAKRANEEFSKKKKSKPPKYEKTKIEEPVKIKKDKPVKMKKVKIEEEKPIKRKKKKTQMEIITITKEVEAMPKKKEKTIKGPDLTTRFVNSCYRVCCECYCWMTIIVLIAFIIFCFM